MAISGTIEGYDTLNSFLMDHTKELDKTVIGSLTKGGRVIQREVIARMPDKLKVFKSIFGIKKVKSNNACVTVGFFGRKLSYVNRRGVKWDAFNLLYWSNYGTLSNRDASHTFTKGRRSVSKKWKGGIAPLRFFDKAVDASFDQALTVASDDLGSILDKVSNKYGFK